MKNRNAQRKAVTTITAIVIIAPCSAAHVWMDHNAAIISLSMKWKDYSCRCGPLFHISLKNICVSSDVVSRRCVEKCGDDCMGRVYRDCAEIVVVAVIDSCLLAAFYHFLAERYATSKRSANEIVLPSVCLSVTHVSSPVQCSDGGFFQQFIYITW